MKKTTKKVIGAVMIVIGSSMTADGVRRIISGFKK